MQDIQQYRRHTALLINGGQQCRAWCGCRIAIMIFSTLLNSTPASALTTTLLSLFGLYYFFFSSKKSGSSGDGKKRAMSFSSLTMVRGSFPPVCNVSEPIINILTIFHELPSEKETKNAFSQLFEMFRFRATPVYSLESRRWEFHEVSTNINDHILTSTFPTEAACYQEIERLSKSSFEHMKGKPQWVFHRIINQGKGHSFMLLRVHHVIGDGIALVLAIDRVFTNAKGERVKTALPGSKYDQKSQQVQKKSNKPSLFSNFMNFLGSFLRVISLATTNYDSNIAFTSATKENLAMNIQNQSIVYLPNISLDYVKELKNKANATINDIMLGAMTGAIRRYCEKLNDPLMKSGEQLQMRALLPISFPRPESELNDTNQCLRNLWCFLSAPMPINEKTPEARVKSSMNIMETLKKSYEAMIQFWLMNYVLCHSPLFVIHDTAQKTFTRHSLVFSNVPGPQHALYLCGKELLSIQVIFPNILAQTIILSYNGSICGNLVVDSTIVKNCDILKECYLEEMKELGEVYGVDSQQMIRKL